MRISSMDQARLRGQAMISALDTSLAMPVPEPSGEDRGGPLSPPQRAALERALRELRDAMNVLRGEHAEESRKLQAFDAGARVARDEGREDLADQATQSRAELARIVAEYAEELRAMELAAARAEARLRETTDSP